VKISILLFYRRLFDTKRFNLVSIIVASSVIAYWLCFTLVAIFQCYPVHHTWDKSASGKCVDTYALLMAASVLYIINDIVIVIMPIPVVWCLRVSRQQKMGLTGLFLLGSLYVTHGAAPYLAEASKPLVALRLTKVWQRVHRKHCASSVRSRHLLFRRSDL
jgi:hypothetical protein